MLFCVGVDGAISKALLLGNFEAAVKLCIRNNRMVGTYLILYAFESDTSNTVIHTGTGSG